MIYYALLAASSSSRKAMRALAASSASRLCGQCFDNLVQPFTLNLLGKNIFPNMFSASIHKVLLE